MKKYLVTWEIDIEANDTVEAARKAYDAMTRTNSIANVFTVIDQTNKEHKSTVVDLLEEDEKDIPYESGGSSERSIFSAMQGGTDGG